MKLGESKLGESKPCINILAEQHKINTSCKVLLDIIKQYKIIKHANILDIGCGNGFYVFGLSDYVNSIYGLDPSSTMLQSAKKTQKHLNKTNIKFIKGSIENNSLDLKFDILIFSYSLHFTNDSYKSLLLAINHLTPSGLLIIIEPTNTYISNKLICNHKDFDKKHYELKQGLLKKSREDIHIFLKDHELLYYNYNDFNFITVIKIL